MGATVEFRRVVKRFASRHGQRTTVLAGIDLFCPAGATLLVTGRSGTGKSTLLNLVAGLYPPDEGSVRVGDLQLERLGETARDRFRAEQIGYVFQTFNLLSPLTALENLHVTAALAGRGGSASRGAARQVLVELGLEEHLDKRPYELSVGQRQRVAVGRALLGRPAVLLADEPTANLDRRAAEQVVEAMARLRDEGTTLLVATHDPAVRAAFAGPCIDVETGEVAA